MKKLKLIFACLLMAILSIGQVWAATQTGSITFDFEDDGAHRASGNNSYAAGPQSYSENDVTISCYYMDVVTTGTPINGSANALGRVAKNKTTSPVLLIGPIDLTDKTITEITYYTKGATTLSQVCEYSTNGSSWTEAVESFNLSTTSTQKSSGTISVAGTNTFYVRITTSVSSSTTGNRDLQIDDVVISYSYEESGTPTCVAPTFSPAAGAVVSGTEVTISSTTEGATIYYTTDGNDPTTSSATTQPVTITAATTLKAIAVKDGNNNSAVATAEYTILTPLTTMQAIFDKATEVGTTATTVAITFNNWVVTGVKNSNAYVTDGTKGFIIYTASHGFNVGDILSGTAICKVQLYNGSAELTELPATKVTVNTGGTVDVNVLDATGIENLTGANTGSLIKISGECTKIDSKYYIQGIQLFSQLYSFSVSEGTSYDCTGIYVLNTSYGKEIVPRNAEDIVISSSIAVTGVTLTESTASIEAGDNVTLHATVEPSTATNKNIVWSVESGSDYASVADGVVTGIAAGEAVIRATSAENASIYDECTVTVSAADPTKHKVTFDATIDIAETGVLTLTKDNVTMTITGGTLENGTDYRCYKNQTLTLECSVGNVIKIEFTGVSGKPVSNFADPAEGTLETEGNDGVWTGDAASVAFTASTDQVRATLIKVTYKEDTRAESGLAWDPADDIEITVGDAFTAPTLSNPNGIDASAITIESDNPDLAVVNDGVVSLVPDATGSTTITATFAGNDDFKPATVSYSITVNGATPVLTDYYEKVTSGSVAEGTYLIVYEAGSLAFDGGADPLDAVGNSIAVDIVSGNKIGVTTETSAATFYIDPTAGTIQAANGKYIGQTSDANGLGTSESASAYTNSFSFDEGNAVIVSSSAHLCYNSASNQLRFRYYKSSSYSSQQPIALYKLANEVIKPASGLAWDPADDIEITVGDAFTAPTLLNPNSIPAGDITIESSNTDLATVTNGVVELVADATGSATITATYTGETYKPTTVSYKIKVNPAASIYVSPSLNVNFGPVVKDAALPADKTITVTLNNVAAATATLGGTNPEAFSITPDALTENGDITISVIASTAAAATYSATITITDDANVAAEKVVNLSFAVTEPAAEETPVSTTSKWVAAVAGDIVDGAEVLITGVKSDETYAMSAASNNGNNRTSVAGTLNEGVFTPGENTMSFTLVATGTENTFYIKTSNDKYLYNASTSGNSYLRTKDNNEDASWTITLDGDGNAVITSVENTNRQLMRFNNGGSNALFNCYATGQAAVKLYVPQAAPVLTTVREGLTAGNYYTICYPKAMTSVTGATFWSFVGKDTEFAYIEQETATTIEAGKPYLMYATAATVQAVLEGDAVTTAGSNGALHGTFENLVQEQLDGFGSDVYLVIGNELRRATGAGTGSNTLPANRAYVKLSDITEGAPAHAPGKNIRTMPMHKDATTGIDDINASDAPRKVMIDGALFIIRGEKAYDATGRLVK